jgi:uncharacterized protein (DUF983 family)
MKHLCPNCAAHQSTLRLITGVLKRKQSCWSCHHQYRLYWDIDSSNVFANFDILIAVAILSIFISSWIVWVVVVLAALAVMYVRGAKLRE